MGKSLRHVFFNSFCSRAYFHVLSFFFKQKFLNYIYGCDSEKTLKKKEPLSIDPGSNPNQSQTLLEGSSRSWAIWTKSKRTRYGRVEYLSVRGIVLKNLNEIKIKQQQKKIRGLLGLDFLNWRFAQFRSTHLTSNACDLQE